MSKKNVALFFTAGISDLKFVGKDGNLLELTKLRGPPRDFASVREVHEALLSLGPDGVAVYPFDRLPPDVPFDLDGSKGKSVHVGFLSNHENSLLDQAPVNADLTPFALQTLSDGRILLAADKLIPAWKAIVKKGRRSVLAVVGFRTQRESRDDEPIAAEKLIYDRACARLKPLYHCLMPYLAGQETLEMPDGTFLPAAVDRIDRGVRACRDALGDTEAEPWLATTGGIPAVKDVIRAAAELHFGPARSVQRREDGISASFRQAPQDRLIARRHALQLVRRGALIEAAAVAAPFQSDPDALTWVHPLRCAARFLDDNPVAAYARGSYPRSAAAWEPAGALPALPGFIQDLAQEILPKDFSQPKRRSLLVGLRAEAALRAEKWVEAINLSVTFYDAALRDALETRLHGHFSGDREFTLNSGQAMEEDARQKLCEARYAVGGTALPCLTPTGESGVTFSIISSRNHDDAIAKFMGNNLEDMNNQLAPLRVFRNRNTHDVLSEAEIRRAIEAFRRSSMWESRNDKTTLFLAPLPAAVLADLGYALNEIGNPLDYLIRHLEGAILSGPKGQPA